MTHTKCIVCLQPSAQVPPEYLQFSKKLFIQFWKELSTKTNRTESGIDISFPFCSHCRLYFTKFAELNERLKSLSLASDLCRLQEKELVKIRNICSLQRPILDHYNDGDDRLDITCNDLPTATDIFQPNTSDTPKVEIVGSAETIEIVEIIDLVDGDSYVAPNFIESRANYQPPFDVEDKSNAVASTVLTATDQVVDPIEQPRGSFNRTRRKLYKTVEQLSDKKFIYKGKYPFERTDTGFKCLTCSITCKLCKYKMQPIWFHMNSHIQKWHIDSDRIRKVKVFQKFTEIAPDRFQYGNYLFEKSDNKWRCLTCDHLVTIGRGKYKFKYISFHLNTKHENPGKHYMCELCGMHLSTSTNLKRHNITQHPQTSGSYPCISCDKTFKSQLQAQLHEKQAHSGHRSCYICEICGKKFRSKPHLEGHIGFFHNGKRLFKCHECGKAYAAYSSLFVHQNNCHTGKRKYVCDVCGMNFTQSYSIQRHKMTAHKN